MLQLKLSVSVKGTTWLMVVFLNCDSGVPGYIRQHYRHMFSHWHRMIVHFIPGFLLVQNAPPKSGSCTTSICRGSESGMDEGKLGMVSHEMSQLGRVTIKTALPGIGIFFIDIRQSADYLIFIMGIPILIKHPYIKTAPKIFPMPTKYHLVFTLHGM